MAGQPQEPPWQAFPAPPTEKQDTYTSYPQPGAQGYAQAYSQPAQSYPGPSYGAQDQGYPDQDQGYPRPQGQSQAPQWQSPAGVSQGRPARPRSDGKGFFGALFDFSFTSFVTPKIIKVLYVLITIWIALWALIFLRLGFKYGGAAGGFVTLFVVDPIFVLLTLGAYRVVLELFMVVHRMHDELRAIRQRGDGA